MFLAYSKETSRVPPELKRFWTLDWRAWYTVSNARRGSGVGAGVLRVRQQKLAVLNGRQRQRTDLHNPVERVLDLLEQLGAKGESGVGNLVEAHAVADQAAGSIQVNTAVADVGQLQREPAAQIALYVEVPVRHVGRAVARDVAYHELTQNERLIVRVP